jgi:hypothetical protein
MAATMADRWAALMAAEMAVWTDTSLAAATVVQ